MDLIRFCSSGVKDVSGRVQYHIQLKRLSCLIRGSHFVGSIITPKETIVFAFVFGLKSQPPPVPSPFPRCDGLKAVNE